MITSSKIASYCQEIADELHHNILPFWIKHGVDNENKGFYGLVANDLNVYQKAEKSCILNSRILWTYASAYRYYHDPLYQKVATRAYEFLINHFWDKEYSGLYWMVNYQGEVVNDRKQIYNCAFGIYGLSEYYRASGDTESLAKAIELFNLIEDKSYDYHFKGYFEAFSRNWLPIDDCRLSENDLNEKKSMNTHLHIMEAYTNLLRVWKNDNLQERLKELIILTLERIIDSQTYHFKLFFNEKWSPASKGISYGHDIEGSWLLYEAAKVLNDPTLLGKVKNIVVNMAQRVLDEGLDKVHGGIYYESNLSFLDTDKHWWPQAEAMVGFMNAYELTGQEYFFEASYSVWQFVKEYIIDSKNGEWFSKVSVNGQLYGDLPKVGPWKCPYHNSRACYEMIERLAISAQLYA